MGTHMQLKISLNQTNDKYKDDPSLGSNILVNLKHLLGGKTFDQVYYFKHIYFLLSDVSECLNS